MTSSIVSATTSVGPGSTVKMELAKIRARTAVRKRPELEAARRAREQKKLIRDTWIGSFIASFGSKSIFILIFHLIFTHLSSIS
jgi:hypothetical protein